MRTLFVIAMSFAGIVSVMSAMQNKASAQVGFIHPSRPQEASSQIKATAVSKPAGLLDVGIDYGKSVVVSATGQSFPGPAAYPVPSSFKLIASSTGVAFYEKTLSGRVPFRVVAIDLRKATIINQCGTVNPNQTATNKLVGKMAFVDHVSAARSKATSTKTLFAQVSGTFFNPAIDPTTVSFGLKQSGQVISKDPDLGTFTKSQIQVLLLKQDRANIQPFAANWFTDSTIPDLVGGLSKDANISSTSTSTGRTFVGIRDDDNNSATGFETVFFFSSQGASQSECATALSTFGASAVMMLDGGATTALYVRNQNNDQPYYVGRKLPQTFAIYAGK